MTNKKTQFAFVHESCKTGDKHCEPSEKTRLAYVAEHEPLFYSIKDACMALRLGRTTIFSLLANKRLHRVRHGRRSLIPKASVDAYIADLMAQQGGDRG